MSHSRPFSQVDVFSATPLRGNPVAVVHEADGLSDAEMQLLANWTNLSETTFLLSPRHPDADYRLRIFTPRSELSFAGHPTLGSCRAWLEQGGRPKRPGHVVQECNVGLVSLRHDDTLDLAHAGPRAVRLAFAAPACRRTAVDASELAALRDALGLSSDEIALSAVLDNGTRWVALLLPDAARVLGLEPDHGALRSLAKVGVIGPHPVGLECQLELRAFAASQGIPEDPVTGSLNAAVAQWLLDERRVPERYLAAQGVRVGRAGRVHVAREGEQVWIGGDSTVCVRGELQL